MTPLADRQFPEFHRRDVAYLKLCVDITVYWIGSMFDRAAGILDFYNQSMEIVGRRIKYFETETMGGAREITDEAFDLVPFWLSHTKSRRSFCAMFMEGGTAPNLPSDYAFVIRVREGDEVPVGVARLVLPLDFIADSPSALPDLMQRLVRRMDYESGHGGFAVNWNETGDDLLDAQEEMFVVSQRYLGIDLSELVATMSAVPDGIKCANWLTLLSADYLGRLGGGDALRRRLGPDVPVHELANGVLIQAGSRPDTGDVNYGRMLPLYRRVGQAVADIRSKTHAPFLMHGDDVYDEELTEEWLGRFDQ